MEFRIDAVLPATSAQLWAIFFDVQRVATLIPGCENVAEVEPLKEFSAVMKQKIGPFKLEVPTRILVESHTVERQVVLVAAGSDKFTGTTIDVRLKVDLEEQRGANGDECRLAVDAGMQVAGRLASLGYPIVKKRSEELFAEFERRLRLELVDFDRASARTMPAAVAAVPAGPAAPQVQPAPQAQPWTSPLPAAASRAQAPAPAASRPGRIELVLLWPRVGISVAVGIAVAHGAVAFGQSPWWWLAAPLLGVAAGLGRRGD
jgi:carbon monoxide dehydrogenase subunit G